MRPLTNANVVLDFYRHLEASYYGAVTSYLAGRGLAVPDYELQYRKLLQYYRDTKVGSSFSSRPSGHGIVTPPVSSRQLGTAPTCTRHSHSCIPTRATLIEDTASHIHSTSSPRQVLHRYSKFALSATMSSTPNTKSLQLVCDADNDAVFKLGRSSYYKYRAANLMFGFNTGITGRLGSFVAAPRRSNPTGLAACALSFGLLLMAVCALIVGCSSPAAWTAPTVDELRNVNRLSSTHCERTNYSPSMRRCSRCSSKHPPPSAPRASTATITLWRCSRWVCYRDRAHTMPRSHATSRRGHNLQLVSRSRPELSQRRCWSQVGQAELVDVHAYTYEIDLHAMSAKGKPRLARMPFAMMKFDRVPSGTSSLVLLLRHTCACVCRQTHRRGGRESRARHQSGAFEPRALVNAAAR